MNTIRTLKTAKPYTLYGVINWLFVLCGGKLYLDWILITNPISRNPIIKLLYGWMRKAYTARDCNARYHSAYIYGGIHLVFMIIQIASGSMWSVDNMVVNVYPVIVQAYIGYRCYRVKACL